MPVIATEFLFILTTNLKLKINAVDRIMFIKDVSILILRICEFTDGVKVANELILL